MRHFSTLLCALFLVVASGCRPAPPEAPTELDDLVHFFFDELDLDNGTLVGDGAENLGEWFDTSAEVEDGWAEGTVSELSATQLGALDDMLWDPDPSLAVGVYILTELDCTWEHMMYVYLEPEQLTLFPDNYESYERTFDTEPECFEDESCDLVDWHSEVTDSIAGMSMDYGLVTRMKRFWYPGDDETERQVVLGRNLMPEAAEENINAAGFEQSYHIEVYIPRGEQKALHLYGLWNYGYIDGVSDDANFWPNQYLDGLIEWDERIQELCTEVLSIRRATPVLLAAAVLVVCTAATCNRRPDPEPAESATPEPKAQRRSPPEGVRHPGNPLGVTEGIGAIPPPILRDYDLSQWPGEASADADRLAEVGARWYRHHSNHFPAFHQRALEEDEFTFQYQDELVRAVQARGADILLVIGRTNGIASCRQFTQQLPESYLPAAGEEEDRYRAYVRAVAERYDADGVDDMPELAAPIRWFQLGNENDLHYESCQAEGREYASPEQYLALARITSEELEAASPETRLVASMTFGHVTEPKSRWTETLLGLEEGAAAGIFDALDMHDYSCRPPVQATRIEELHALADLPIWITETSVPGDPAAKDGFDQEVQARTMVTLVCQALASGHVERVFWHTLMDGPPRPRARQWRAFGTNSLYGCVDPVAPVGGKPPRCSGFEIKPAGRTFALLSEALDGVTAVEVLDRGAGWLIRRDGLRDALVLSPGDRTVDARALLGVDQVTAVDMVLHTAVDGTPGPNPVLVYPAEEK